jgi:hypothetical protein
MNGPPPSTPSQTSARPYACAACGRRFVVVGLPAGAHAGPRCVCGEVLAETPLSSGIYEIRKSRRASRRRPPTRKVAGASPPSMPHEPDLGYGESHGYGPAHGGPTGPGDAPALDEPSSEPLHHPDEDPSAPRS